MNAEFEEKQFEQHLNFELAARHDLVYPPGQVGEGFLGFDAALWTMSRPFWRAFLRRRPPGIMLDPGWWEELEGHGNFFPKCKFNVFVQCKRPEHLTLKTSKEWKDWNVPYYRYELVEHQQKALDALAKRVAKSAIVTYASPSFHTRSELWDCISQHTLTSRMNFAEVAHLASHKRYTYSAPGVKGKAYSNPVDIESVEFAVAVAQLRERTEGQSLPRFLRTLASDISGAIEILDPRDATRELWRDIVRAGARLPDSLQPFVKVMAFLFVTGVSWLIGVEQENANDTHSASTTPTR